MHLDIEVVKRYAKGTSPYVGIPLLGKGGVWRATIVLQRRHLRTALSAPGLLRRHLRPRCPRRASTRPYLIPTKTC